ncbi:lantibiotic dehydratase [Umezawaea tangerina]|uniref:Lantibiotic biosynthesis dehydratase-like protein n=1 Tax=Umezawaea tangerina TaxID=84725 RepID=A0A2T0SU49_9PSEU|nr:lantibiotic dehydratase [Umezawaea tangerina]PRY36946.1 lantibiotic biosynthesis dehydratase-like protein [Umezawaea tangerina]
MGSQDSSHLVPLDGAGWHVWREFVLRGAGFPAADVLLLSDQELAEAGERSWRSPDDLARFRQDWDRWQLVLRPRLRDLAADPRFREALAWQNPTMVRNALDKVRSPRVPGKRPDQGHLLAMANYLQRYTTKNDTIGFFGPAVWARLTDDEEAVRLRHGAELVTDRRLYFEVWAIDALAERLARDPDVQPWLVPRPVGGCWLDGDLLRRPHGEPVRLSAEHAGLLRACDGTRTVRDLGADALPTLLDWRDRHLVRLSLEGPVEAHPERALRDKLVLIGDQAARRRALDLLDELVQARDTAAASAGDADKVLASVAELDETFRRVTGQDATRRHGESYAGRKVVYEDTRRAVDLELGLPVRRAVAAPLGLLADSARWLIARAGRNYLDLLGALFDRCLAHDGGTSVPLARLVGVATPHLLVRTGLPRPVAAAVAEFQDRWARVLEVPAGVREHSVRAEEIAGRVAELFPSSPLPWSSARYLSPDLMIAADGPNALRRGDFTVVLGELHLATNTVESRLFVERHPDRVRLLAASARDHADRRIYSVPTKDWPQVNSRVYPAALLSERFYYWCLHDDNSGAPGPVMPSAALEVHREAGRLVVRSRRGDGEFDLLEVLGEQLSAAVVDAFRPLPPAPHRPRVSIDRLVLARRTWSFPPAEIGWATAKQPVDRFRAAQRWRTEQDLPRLAFYKVRGERKPIFLDFAASLLVDRFAKAVRQAGDQLEPAPVTVSEMLPDLSQNWLVDATGAGYTSELRLVLVDQGEDAA